MKKMFCFAIPAIVAFSALGAVSKDTGSCEQCGQSLSQAFINVAKKCRPAVVHIRVEAGSGQSHSFGDSGNPFEMFQDELFNRFFGAPGGGSGGRGQPQNSFAVSNGSGFIVSSDGYIVTNYHVIKDGGKIVVEKYDEIERQYDAKLIGCDPNTDLAVLKIEADNLVFLEFADSDEIEVGQWTMAIGHPFKLRDSVSAGVISATHRGDLQISQLEDFIQTDAAINPGHSGGPLVDLNGKVIGVNTAILSKTGGNIGVGFAVPSNIAQMVSLQIRESGSVDRAFLGVQIQDLNDDLCTGFKLKKGTTGALIAEVMPDSAAALAGLQAGDLVVDFNGEVIKSSKQLYTVLGKLPSGSKCSMNIFRDGKQKKISLVLGSKVKEASTEGDIIHKLGIFVEQITTENAGKYGIKADEKGVVVTKVLSGSIASILGWTPGSVILVVNGQKIASVNDFKASLESANPKDRLVILMHNHGRASFHSIPHPNSRS
jgi:serine protease Do